MKLLWKNNLLNLVVNFIKIMYCANKTKLYLLPAIATPPTAAIIEGAAIPQMGITFVAGNELFISKYNSQYYDLEVTNKKYFKHTRGY